MIKLILAIGVWVAMMGVLVAFAVVVAKNRPGHKNHLSRFVQVGDGITAGYVPAHNTNIFVLYVKNPGLVDKGDYWFGITMADGRNWKYIFSAQNAGDPSDLRIQFPPIANSDQQVATLYVEPVRNPGALQIGVAQDNSLAFAAYYFRFPTGAVIWESIQSLIGKIAADPRFLLIWTGGIALCAVIYLRS